MSNPLAQASFEARSARLRMVRAELLPLTATAVIDIMGKSCLHKQALKHKMQYYKYPLKNTKKLLLHSLL